MSEEEKKAIETMNTIIEFGGDNLLCKEHRKQLQTILKLINKQQKEIEKLKQEMEERLIGREEITKYEMGYEIENNYISKDKIREKIKEYQNKLFQDIEENKVVEYENIIQVLEELLEE